MIFKYSSVFYLIILISCFGALFGSDPPAVKISGLAHVPESEVRTVLLEAMAASGKEVPEKYLEKTLDELGWFSEVSVTRSPSGDIIVSVKEYPAVSRIVIQGNTLLDENRIVELLGLRRGRVFNKSEFYRNIPRLYEFYQKRGYTQVEISGVDIKPDGTLILALTEWKVGRILLPDKIRTKNNVLRKILLPGPGRVYNSRRLRLAIEELDYTGAFESIQVEAVRSETEGILDLKTRLVERGLSPSLYLQYDGFKAFSGSAGWDDKNFLGRLEPFSLRDNFYHQGSSFSHRLDAVWKAALNRGKNLDLKLAVKGGYWRKKAFTEPETGKRNIFSLGGSAGLEKKISGSMFLGAGLLLEHWGVRKNENGETEEEGFFGRGLFSVPYLEMTVLKEDRLRRRGWSAGLRVETGLKKEHSDIRFAVTGEYYGSLFSQCGVVVNAESGFSSRQGPALVRRFWVGNGNFLPYFRHEEFALSRYGLVHSRLEFPYVLNLVRFSPFITFITPFERTDSLGRGAFVYGLETRFNLLVVSLVVRFSLRDGRGLRSGIFTLALK